MRRSPDGDELWITSIHTRCFDERTPSKLEMRSTLHLIERIDGQIAIGPKAIHQRTRRNSKRRTWGSSIRSMERGHEPVGNPKRNPTMV